MATPIVSSVVITAPIISAIGDLIGHADHGTYCGWGRDERPPVITGCTGRLVTVRCQTFGDVISYIV